MVRAGGHTWNIACMFVTLDVSQLEMSSLKASKPSNRPPMSVIDETVQPEIGPYVLRAVARSSFHIWTAVSRAALVTRDGGGDTAPAIRTDVANMSMRALVIGPWEAGASSRRLEATPPATAANAIAAIAEEAVEEPAEKPPLRPMPPPLDPWCRTSMSVPKRGEGGGEGGGGEGEGGGGIGDGGGGEGEGGGGLGNRGGGEGEGGSGCEYSKHSWKPAVAVCSVTSAAGCARSPWPLRRVASASSRSRSPVMVAGSPPFPVQFASLPMMIAPALRARRWCP